MRIKIRTGRIRWGLPIPLGLVGFAIRMIPDSELNELRREIPAPYNQWVTKENLYFLYQECRESLESCRGLEIIHVETSDNTFVSITV